MCSRQNEYFSNKESICSISMLFKQRVKLLFFLLGYPHREIHDPLQVRLSVLNEELVDKD